MAALVSLKDTTKANDIYKAVTTTLARFALDFGKISGITTDGAPAMVGKREGLMKLIENEALWSDNTNLRNTTALFIKRTYVPNLLKLKA